MTSETTDKDTEPDAEELNNHDRERLRLELQTHESITQALHRDGDIVVQLADYFQGKAVADIEDQYPVEAGLIEPEAPTGDNLWLTLHPTGEATKSSWRCTRCGRITVIPLSAQRLDHRPECYGPREGWGTETHYGTQMNQITSDRSEWPGIEGHDGGP